MSSRTIEIPLAHQSCRFRGGGGGRKVPIGACSARKNQPGIKSFCEETFRGGQVAAVWRVYLCRVRFASAATNTTTMSRRGNRKEFVSFRPSRASTSTAASAGPRHDHESPCSRHGQTSAGRTTRLRCTDGRSTADRADGCTSPKGL